MRGRHSSPERGACVLELASMLAAEPFSDQPHCVCPVIAEFLRTYNDGVDNARRQDLYAYAALAVDTRSDHATERERADSCLEWWLAEAAPRATGLRRFFWQLAPGLRSRDVEIAYRAARWAAASPERHSAALELVETLIGRAPVGIDAAPREGRGPASRAAETDLEAGQQRAQAPVEARVRVELR